MKTLLMQVRLLLVLLILCCGIYPAVVWAAGRALFSHQAEGSLVRDSHGVIIGSELLGQEFTSPRYFHSRPSAVAWNASGSGGSNLGPTNSVLVSRIADSITSATELDGVTTATVAADR